MRIFVLSTSLILGAMTSLRAFDEPQPALNQSDQPQSLTEHLPNALIEQHQRGLAARWENAASGPVLQLQTTEASRYAWCVLPEPPSGWDLSRRRTVQATLKNIGEQSVKVQLWVVADHGWDACVDAATLQAGQERTFQCDLRGQYPDGTPLVDPQHIKQLQWIIVNPTPNLRLEMRELVAAGSSAAFVPPTNRLIVPPIEDSPPAAGRRVRYRLRGDARSAIYCILHLPEDWSVGKRYPLVVEYPGNIYFTPGCYSTGLPDQCVIGFGMTKGRQAICLSLPFIDRSADQIAENAWGVPDDTVEYALRAVNEVCEAWGADRERIVLTGFSRGALACGFIGLRDDRIAALWRGFHACQHYDGDGWNGATMATALERAKRFRGKSVFQTDNSEELFRPVMEQMRTPATFVQSGLGAHACAMFLDDRPSTQQLRRWFRELVQISPDSDP